MRSDRLVLALGAVLVAVGCGADTADSSRPFTTGTEDSALTVVATDVEFDASSYTAAAGTVEVTLIQRGELDHSLVIENERGELLNLRLLVERGQTTDTGTIDLEPGTYVLWCDIPGHRELGQEAALVVD